ncbi:MAG: NAD(P)-binding domain-containing protein [Labilithrix sp.]
MRIGIIGAGQVGTTLGRAWTGLGHEVIYTGRDRASTRRAVEASEVVALAVPWAAVGEALAAAGDLEDKVLVDVTNPIGPGFALTHGHTTSGGEEVAALAKNARVVKAFNTTGLENMASPSYGARRVVMPVAGDDPGAVATVVGLASGMGFEAVPLHGLAHARELEPFGMLWIKLAMEWGYGRSVAFAIARREAGDERPPPATARHVRRRIAVVGGGHIGGALARGWQSAGHDVRVVGRDGLADGATDRDVVAFAVPAGAVAGAARAMGGLAGRIVIDCTNAIAKGMKLEVGHTTSSAEELAKALPDARVVRAFNQQGAEVLENPIFGGQRATSFVAADDPEARRVVATLSEDLGLDAVPAGPLSSSRYLEPITLLWIAMAQSIGSRQYGLSLVRR